MGPFAVVVEEGGKEVRGGGSCFQLWFAVKSDVHVRYRLAGQDTRLSPERPRVPVAEYCLSCEGVGEHVFPPLLSSVLIARSV